MSERIIESIHVVAEPVCSFCIEKQAKPFLKCLHNCIFAIIKIDIRCQFSIATNCRQDAFILLMRQFLFIGAIAYVVSMM